MQADSPPVRKKWIWSRLDVVLHSRNNYRASGSTSSERTKNTTSKTSKLVVIIKVSWVSQVKQQNDTCVLFEWIKKRLGSDQRWQWKPPRSSSLSSLRFYTSFFTLSPTETNYFLKFKSSTLCLTLIFLPNQISLFFGSCLGFICVFFCCHLFFTEESWNECRLRVSGVSSLLVEQYVHAEEVLWKL